MAPFPCSDPRGSLTQRRNERGAKPDKDIFAQSSQRTQRKIRQLIDPGSSPDWFRPQKLSNFFATLAPLRE
jgi:hypothetical protein